MSILVIAIIILNFSLNYFRKIESGKCSNKEILYEAIRIQYRGGSKKKIEGIFTDEFIDKIDLESSFYKKGLFYSIDESSIVIVKNINEDEFIISVRVEDLYGNYIQQVTLTKGSDGKCLISDIKYDI